MPKSVMEGRKPVEWLNMRWRDNFVRDLREIGMEDTENNWRDAAQIRETWRGLVQAARDHQEVREPHGVSK